MWFDILNTFKRESKKTTEQISEESGVPKGTLNKLFAGQTKDPQYSTLRAVVHCLGHTVDDLEGTQKTPPPDDGDDIKTQLIDNYDRMNAAGHNELLKQSRLLLLDDQYLACGKFDMGSGIA